MTCALLRQISFSCAHVCLYTFRALKLIFLVLLGPDDTLLFIS